MNNIKDDRALTETPRSLPPAPGLACFPARLWVPLGGLGQRKEEQGWVQPAWTCTAVLAWESGILPPWFPPSGPLTHSSGPCLPT